MSKFKRIGPGSAKLQPNTEIKFDQTIRSTINSMNDVVQGFSSNQQKDNKKNYNNFSIFKDIKILINNIFLGLKSQRLRQKQHFEIVEKFTKTLLDKIDKLSKVNNTTQRDDYPKINKELLDTFVKTFNKDILASLTENIQAINDKLKTDNTTQINDINSVLSNFSTFLANQKTIISNISESNNKLLEKILSSNSVQLTNEQTLTYVNTENINNSQNYPLTSEDVRKIIGELSSINSKLSTSSTENSILKNIEGALNKSNELLQENLSKILTNKQQNSSDIENYVLTLVSNLKQGQTVFNGGSTTSIVNKIINNTSTTSTLNTSSSSNVSTSTVTNNNGYNNALDFNIIRQLFVDSINKQNQSSPQLTKSEKDIIHPYDILSNKTSGKLLSLSGKPEHSMLFDNPNSLGIKVLTEFQHQNIKLLTDVKNEITNIKHIFLDYIKFNKDQLYRKNLYDSAMNDEGRYGGLSGGLLGLGGGSGNGRGGNDGDINDPNKKFNFGLLPTLLGGGAGVYGLYKGIKNVRQAYHNFKVRNRARRINNIRNKRIKDVRRQRAANRARTGRPRRLRDPKAVRARARNINRIRTKRINAARNARATSMKNAGRALRRGRGGGWKGKLLTAGIVLTATAAPVAANYITSKNDSAPEESEEENNNETNEESSEEPSTVETIANGASDTANAALLANMVKNSNLKVTNPLKGWKSASKWGKFGKALGPIMAVAEAGLAGYEMYDAHNQAEELEKQGEFIEAEKLRKGSYADFGTSTAHAIAYAIPGVNAVVAGSDIAGLIMDNIPFEKMGMSKEFAEDLRLAFKPFEAVSTIIKSYQEVSEEAFQKQANFRREKQLSEIRAVINQQVTEKQKTTSEQIERSLEDIQNENKFSDKDISDMRKKHILYKDEYPSEYLDLIHEIYDFDKGEFKKDIIQLDNKDYLEKFNNILTNNKDNIHFDEMKKMYDAFLKIITQYEYAVDKYTVLNDYQLLKGDGKRFRHDRLKVGTLILDNFGSEYGEFYDLARKTANGDVDAFNKQVEVQKEVRGLEEELYTEDEMISDQHAGEVEDMTIRLLAKILRSNTDEEQQKWLDKLCRLSNLFFKKGKQRLTIIQSLDSTYEGVEKDLEDDEFFKELIKKIIRNDYKTGSNPNSINNFNKFFFDMEEVRGDKFFNRRGVKDPLLGGVRSSYGDVNKSIDLDTHRLFQPIFRSITSQFSGNKIESPETDTQSPQLLDSEINKEERIDNFSELLKKQLEVMKKIANKPPAVYYVGTASNLPPPISK